MTPRQKNDYGFLPEHPKPRDNFVDSDPVFTPRDAMTVIAIVAFVVGMLLVGVYFAGRHEGRAACAAAHMELRQ